MQECEVTCFAGSSLLLVNTNRYAQLLGDDMLKVSDIFG